MGDGQLKVALVGCGQIADAHLQEARKLPDASVVAVCDQHIDLARQAAARFDVPGVFDDFGRLLRDVRPDVVHVTTPPHTHRALALEALRGGAHVYVEKPFTVDAGEAEDVIRAATGAGRLVCVGHDQLFDPVWAELRALVRGGALGRVVHVESVQGYDLGGPFGRVLSGEPGHWVHRLPGGLFQNVVSHPLYKITDLLPDAAPQVWAAWFRGGGSDFPTELRAVLRGAEVTAGLLFSSAARPVQRVVRVYGTRQCVEVDFDGRVLRHGRAATLPGPFAKIQVPFRHLREAARSWGRNVWKFVRCDLHYFAGLNNLLARFYRAIREGGEPPIPYGEIVRVTAIMDEIFASCRRNAAGVGVAGGAATGREVAATAVGLAGRV
jgi:predicted dehydrogenase